MVKLKYLFLKKMAITKYRAFLESNMNHVLNELPEWFPLLREPSVSQGPSMSLQLTL